MNRKAFEELLATFSPLDGQTCQTGPRQRAVGGGGKARLLGSQEKLFFILFYFKCYPTFDLAGIIFDRHRSQAHEWMHRLQPILEQTLGKKMVLPERKLDSIEAFLECFREVKRVMIDGTEGPIQRPQDTDAQKANYSGKKKRHARKHLAVVDETKRVLGLTQSREGNLHDKRFHDEEVMLTSSASGPNSLSISRARVFNCTESHYGVRSEIATSKALKQVKSISTLADIDNQICQS